jgi:hypothetical protein
MKSLQQVTPSVGYNNWGPRWVFYQFWDSGSASFR